MVSTRDLRLLPQYVNPFPMTNFRLFQTERVCKRTISNLMKMAESPSKWVGSTVGKGEIAHQKVHPNG